MVGDVIGAARLTLRINAELRGRPCSLSLSGDPEFAYVGRSSIISETALVHTEQGPGALLSYARNKHARYARLRDLPCLSGTTMAIELRFDEHSELFTATLRTAANPSNELLWDLLLERHCQEPPLEASPVDVPRELRTLDQTLRTAVELCAHSHDEFTAAHAYRDALAMLASDSNFNDPVIGILDWKARRLYYAADRATVFTRAGASVSQSIAQAVTRALFAAVNSSAPTPLPHHHVA